MPFQMNENGHARQDLDKDGVHRILRIKFKGIDCKKCKKIYKQKLSLKHFFQLEFLRKIPILPNLPNISTPRAAKIKKSRKKSRPRFPT